MANVDIVDTVLLARWVERLCGLLMRQPDERVYVLVPCHDVHTFGMRHEIDIAFADKAGRVCAVYRAVGSGRRVCCAQAHLTIERFSREGRWLVVGDRVRLCALPDDAA